MSSLFVMAYLQMEGFFNANMRFELSLTQIKGFTLKHK